jgi:Putative MetA-pathway of phenol degradation
MKRLIPSLIVLLSINTVAQQTNLSPTKERPGSVISSAHGTLRSSVSESEADPLPPQTSKSTTAQKTKKPPRPVFRGSMVGYVDDAIVGSQIRIRFDAGFHDNAPDRADFFYAQYAGLNGPGPKSVVADLNFQQLYLRAEYAQSQRLSFFTELPVRWIQPQLIVADVSPTDTLTNEAGLSDVAAGFKLAALASPHQYLTFQFQAYFPSGNASSGLGTGHYSVEPALLYYQSLSDRVALEAQVGDSHPIGGSSCRNPCESSNTSGPNSQGFAGDVFFYGVGPSYILYRGEHVQIAPVIEMVGWRVLGGLETNCLPSLLDCSNQEGVSADGTNILNLKVGARAMVGAHSSFYIGYGHQLTHAIWYKEIVRAEYRYSF